MSERDKSHFGKASQEGETIHANSPGYGTDLPLSSTGHHISQIKSSSELFCALVWDLARFYLKTWIFLIRNTVSRAFLHVQNDDYEFW